MDLCTLRFTVSHSVPSAWNTPHFPHAGKVMSLLKHCRPLPLAQSIFQKGSTLPLLGIWFRHTWWLFMWESCMGSSLSTKAARRRAQPKHSLQSHAFVFHLLTTLLWAHQWISPSLRLTSMEFTYLSIASPTWGQAFHTRDLGDRGREAGTGSTANPTCNT